MATIYKRAQSPLFYTAFTDEHGKRVYRSTGTRIKEEAQAISAKWVREARRRRESGSQSQREVADIVQGIEQAANRGDLTEANAREAIVRIFEVTSGQKLQLYTVREWLEHWRGIHSKTESSSATETRNRSIDHVLEALGTAAEKRIDLVTAQDLEIVKKWLSAQKTKAGEPVRATTQNTKIAHLRAAFEEAHVRCIISTNPAKTVKNFKTDDSQLVGDFDELELHKLLKASSGEWHGLITLAAHTGLRRENLLRLKWDEVNLGKRSLFVTLVKRRDGAPKKVATIPLSEDAFQAIEGQSGKHEQFVFAELHQLKKTEPNYYFGKIMKSADVPRVVTRESGIEMKRSFHSLRHTFVSLLAKADVSPEIRQQLTGHADAAVHQIYSHLDQAVLEKGIKVLPSLTPAA